MISLRMKIRIKIIYIGSILGFISKRKTRPFLRLTQNAFSNARFSRIFAYRVFPNIIPSLRDNINARFHFELTQYAFFRVFAFFAFAFYIKIKKSFI